MIWGDALHLKESSANLWTQCITNVNIVTVYIRYNILWDRSVNSNVYNMLKWTIKINSGINIDDFMAYIVAFAHPTYHVLVSHIWICSPSCQIWSSNQQDMAIKIPSLPYPFYSWLLLAYGCWFPQWYGSVAYDPCPTSVTWHLTAGSSEGLEAFGRDGKLTLSSIQYSLARRQCRPRIETLRKKSRQ